MSALPAAMDIEQARLPARYIEAKVALAECARIDVCKDWADKAEALASYARQANDEELQKYAMRIQARAIERCGELLEEIPDASGTRTDLEPQDGTDPRLTRTQAAINAGLSERQRKTALRLANIPDDQFEAAVESPNPPTITELAERGKKPREKPLIDQFVPDLGDRTKAEFQAASQLLGMLDQFKDEIGDVDIDLALRGLADHEWLQAQTDALAICEWIYDLIGELQR